MQCSITHQLLKASEHHKPGLPVTREGYMDSQESSAQTLKQTAARRHALYLLPLQYKAFVCQSPAEAEQTPKTRFDAVGKEQKWSINLQDWQSPTLRRLACTRLERYLSIPHEPHRDSLFNVDMKASHRCQHCCKVLVGLVYLTPSSWGDGSINHY